MKTSQSVGYEEFLSDLHDARPGTFCESWVGLFQDCGATASVVIEVDGDMGKHRMRLCQACGDRKLAELRSNWETAVKLDAEAKERLGVDPKDFCEYCGVRFEGGKRYDLYACKCHSDWAAEEPVRPVTVRLRTAGEIALLDESEGGR